MSDVPLMALANIVEVLERRIDRIEKMLNREFHGSSGYTRGCRCDICRQGRMNQMRAYRKKQKESPDEKA